MKNWTITSKILLVIGILAALTAAYFLIPKKGATASASQSSKTPKKPAPNSDRTGFYTGGYPTRSNYPTPKLWN